MSNDNELGLYNKYDVRRIDGSDKHRNCSYFVLDLQHDKFAIPALIAYAEACEVEFPQLSADLLEFVKEAERDLYIEIDIGPSP